MLHLGGIDGIDGGGIGGGGHFFCRSVESRGKGKKIEPEGGGK